VGGGEKKVRKLEGEEKIRVKKEYHGTKEGRGWERTELEKIEEEYSKKDYLNLGAT